MKNYLEKVEYNLGTKKVEILHFNLIIDENIYEPIRDTMKAKGYAIEKYDICDVKKTELDNKCHVIFKFVHIAAPTMANQPYWLITLTTDTVV